LSESRPARFVGCHAIVTGAASGIGRSISKALAAEGAFVHLVDRQEDGLKETQAAIDSPSEAHVVDISEESQVRQMVSGVVDSADGRIDVLVNCAGTYDIRPLLEVTIDSWEDVLSTNLRGTFLVCREAARHMALRGRGAIVNLSSVAAFVGDPSEPAVHYNGSQRDPRQCDLPGCDRHADAQDDETGSGGGAAIPARIRTVREAGHSGGGGRPGPVPGLG
jgi:NAD(P)-dependent dehydrogenase (short-subunit alcohol dehydrogenase family)